MLIFLTIIAVLVIFSLLILIHEYGHFIAARRAGIKVTEFGIGFPPRLYGKKIGETIYSVNAIPFGGFVRLFGEDATSEAVVKNKRSFIHKSPWVRTKVVVAGVFMNFILAIALLSIGFTFGIQPLLVTEEDLFTHLASGVVKSAPGAYISKVSKDVKQFGIAAGDHLISIDDKPITSDAALSIFEKGKAKKDVDVTIVPAAGGHSKTIHLPIIKNSLGITLKPVTYFPRLAILEVKPNSKSAAAGLRSGDVILRMNGQEIYFPADFETMLSETSQVSFTILRGTETLQIPVNLPDRRRVVIAEVFEKSAAQAAGIRQGDIILEIEGNVILKPQQVQEILKQNAGRILTYRLFRDGDDITIKTKAGDDNRLGIALSTIASFRNTEITFYRGSVLTSITEIGKVKLNPLKAVNHSIKESIRLTGLTVNAFGRTLKSIFSSFAVPTDVGGPVQIAYYTHTFVQEGFFALLRFTAVLSLSLAVINVLPIPALDGGRLLFIIIEVITKKRVNVRVESLIHRIGFALLLLLIFLVTYSDIAKLF